MKDQLLFNCKVGSLCLECEFSGGDNQPNLEHQMEMLPWGICCPLVVNMLSVFLILQNLCQVIVLS